MTYAKPKIAAQHSIGSAFGAETTAAATAGAQAVLKILGQQAAAAS